MALNDLLGELQNANSSIDHNSALKLTEPVLTTLEDASGEVQNMGIKCLGPLVRKATETEVKMIIDRLCKSGQTEELRDISSVALRTVILEISPDSKFASSITKRMVPRLLTQLKEVSSTSDILLDSLEVLATLLSRYGNVVGTLPEDEQIKVTSTLTDLLENPRPAVRKRAVVALGNSAAYMPMSLFSKFMSQLIESLSITRSNEKLKTLVSLLGQICKAEIANGPQRFSNYLQTLAPPVFDSLQIDDDELREIALQSCEAFVLQAGAQIRRYDAEIMQIVLEYLKYDPNYDSGNGEDDEEMEDSGDLSDLGSDFEDDAEYDDDDDISWRIRRCAAKLATAFIRSRPDSLGTACLQIGPALVARFNEREENVRVEILQTFVHLVSQVNKSSPRQQSPSRKRSRDDDQMEIESTALPPRTVLEKLTEKAIKALAKQLNGKSLATKQICFDALSQLAEHQGSTIDDHLDILLQPLQGALLISTGASSSTTTSNMKISALKFLVILLGSRSSAVNAQSELIVLLITTPLLQENLNKVALVAIEACHSLLLAAASYSNTKAYSQVCQALFEKTLMTDLDQDVRDQLIRTVGECISACPIDASSEVNDTACSILADRLRSEATRYVAIVAIGRAVSTSTELNPRWTTNIVGELLKYTNSANKVLRAAAVDTSASLATHFGKHLGHADVKEVTKSIVSLLSSEDSQLLLHVIHWLSALVKNVNSTEQRSVCEASLLAVSKLLNYTLVQNTVQVQIWLLEYFESFSKSSGSSEVVKVLSSLDLTSATLPLASRFIARAILGDENSTQLAQYIKQIKAPKTVEDKRVLALHIIGECGSKSLMDRDVIDSIIAQFASPSEKVRNAAAFALGNAISGDLNSYLPLLFDKLDKHTEDGYLLAVSLKELIFNSSQDDRASLLAKKAEEIWHRLFALATDERARNVVAECVGRLTLVRPHQLLPELRKEIKSDSTTSRAVVIRAVRYTFTAPNNSFDDQLRPFIVDFLSLMEDADLEVRRLALSTLYSAAHNKPHLIQDHLSRLLPLLYQETVIRQDLIHTVQMGPFKHIVDDGLDLRKSAFETVHSLLDPFFASMDVSSIFDIIIRGLADVQEIKTLCFLMISYLATAAPEQTASRLDSLTELLSKIMATKLKEAAVKQDREKDQELKRLAMRCVVSLSPLANESTPGSNTFIKEMDLESSSSSGL